MTKREFLSVNQTAEFLGVSRSTVYRLIRDGTLSPVRIGSRYRFSINLLTSLLASDLDRQSYELYRSALRKEEDRARRYGDGWIDMSA